MAPDHVKGEPLTSGGSRPDSGYRRPMGRCGVLAKLIVCVAACCALQTAPAGAVTSLENPPPGANDFGCKPTAAHPNPVVLVHGLGATMGLNFGSFSPKLKAQGYCVFALTYGIDPRAAAFGGPGGTIPIERSAPELDAFVDRVLTATGAAKVDLVGHSEGTFMPQFWLKFLGGAARTDRYVAWTPLYDGTTLHGVSTLRDLAAQVGLDRPVLDLVGGLCGSCSQFLAGSPMQRKLSEGGAGAPGVTYTTVMTRLDELVIPSSSGVMEAPGATNHVLQEVCPGNLAEHAAVAVDPVTAQLTLNALDPANAKPIQCRARAKKRAATRRGGASRTARR